MMEQTEVQLTLAKGEYLAFLFVCLAGIPLVFCLLLWMQLLETSAVGILLLLVGGVAYFISELAQEQPTYVINKKGVHLGLGLQGQFIPWTDIEGISDERQLDGPPYVGLRLKADAPYWTAISPLRKQLFRVYTWGEAPIPMARLHTAGLAASHQEILATLQSYFQQHQARYASK
jgi:hypothetical protein